MQINWGLGQPVDISGAFQQGAQAGRQQRVERETDNALRQFAQNPDDPNAINSLMRFNPEMGMRLRDQQQTQQRQQQSQQQTGQALGGDMQAFQRLAQTDPEQWARIRPQVENLTRTIGQIAQASNTPQEWDRNIDLLVQQYGEGFARYRGRYDLRRVAIAEAGQMQQFLERQQPRITPVQQGGSVVAFNRDGTGGYIMGGPPEAPSYQPQVDPSAGFVPGQPQQAAPAPQIAPQAPPPPQQQGARVMSRQQAQTVLAAFNGDENRLRQYMQQQGFVLEGQQGAQGNVARVQTVEQAMALPPGTRFIDPDGVERIR